MFDARNVCRHYRRLARYRFCCRRKALQHPRLILELVSELQGLHTEWVVCPVLGPRKLAIPLLPAAPMGYDRVVLLSHRKCPTMCRIWLGCARPFRLGERNPCAA